MWARIAWRRAAAVDGAWFDHVKAQRVVDNWPRWMHFTDDRFAGKPFYLNFDQEIVVRLLVGWKVPVDIHRRADAGCRSRFTSASSAS
jgi:hypothetical protein